MSSPLHKGKAPFIGRSFKFKLGRSFKSSQSRRHGRPWWSWPPKQSTKPQKMETWKAINQWNFYQTFNVKPLAQR